MSNDRDPVGVARAGAPPDSPPPPPFPPPFPPRGRFNAGTGPNTLDEKGEAARLVETLALASVGKNTQKLYLAKWNTWVGERAAQGVGPWLQHNPNNPNQALYELMEFMACRCFVHNNQQSTVRG